VYVQDDYSIKNKIQNVVILEHCVKNAISPYRVRSVSILHTFGWVA